ncbi:MAG: methionyl-tRNA formyltransferase [Chloroherpetonaceae bacterium]
MKLVFMGTPEFAVPSLKNIVESGFDIALVVTSPDKPRRSANDDPEPTPVKKTAQSLRLRVLEVEDLTSPEFERTLRTVQPDVMVVVAFRILPKEIFTIPTKGAFNLHASLLPKYRGAAPINWAIINGETETGVTTFFLQEKVDTGNMILQKSLAIQPNEVATELATRLSELGAEVVVETLRLIESNSVHLIQQDNSLTTKAPKLTKENTRIDWTKPAREVFNFIRGLSERPTAWTTLDNKHVKLYRAALFSETETGEAGKWIVGDETLYVQCGSGIIELLSLQQDGKKRMRVSDFLRGYRPTGSEKFV